MTDADLRLRRLTYALFVELGRAPSVTEVSERAGLSEADTLDGWRRLHDAHALVLNQATDELRMANPFSAVPTSFRVQAGGRWWYANCAWDAFGICAALQSDGTIETSCPDCGEALAVAVVDAKPDPGDLVFHTPVPAARWWDDIVFT